MNKEQFYEKYFNKEQIDIVIGIFQFAKISKDFIIKDAEGIDDEFVKELIKMTEEGEAINNKSLEFYIKLRETLGNK